MAFSHLTGRNEAPIPLRKPVDNSAMEHAREQMRADLAAEVRLREEARRELSDTTAELGRVKEAFAEAAGRIEILDGELATLKKERDDAMQHHEHMREMHDRMTVTHEENARELTRALASAEANRVLVEELRRQLKAGSAGSESALLKRLDRMEAALSKKAPAVQIEPPAYEFQVTGRDGNNRAATIRAVPVKKT